MVTQLHAQLHANEGRRGGGGGGGGGSGCGSVRERNVKPETKWDTHAN